MIFDFDGLILDTETPEVETWRAIFEEHGCEFPDEWWMNAIGRGAEQVITLPEDILEERMGITIDRPGFRAAHRRRLLEAIDRQEVMPGVRELATECRAKGIRVGIASSSFHDWVDGYLAKHGMAEVFEEVVCTDDVERGKPFPDLYLEALRRLGVEASEAVALEDSPNGIRAAKAAGLFCLAVPNPVSRFCDLSQADHQVGSVADLDVETLTRLAARRES